MRGGSIIRDKQFGFSKKLARLDAIKLRVAPTVDCATISW
jgi:hypothetical protein